MSAHFSSDSLRRARPELWKTPAISDKSSVGLCGARPVQLETATNHCVRKSQFNPSLLSTNCPGLPIMAAGVCVFVRLSKSMSSIPNNFLSPSSGSSWDSLICQSSPTARPGQPCVNKPGSASISQWVRVAGAVKSPTGRTASVTFLLRFLHYMMNIKQWFLNISGSGLC